MRSWATHLHVENFVPISCQIRGDNDVTNSTEESRSLGVFIYVSPQNAHSTRPLPLSFLNPKLRDMMSLKRRPLEQNDRQRQISRRIAVRFLVYAEKVIKFGVDTLVCLQAVGKIEEWVC